MLSRIELEQLSRYRNPNYPVTSFFLNIDKGRPDELKYNIRLKNVLARAEELRNQWTKAQQDSIDQDLERIKSFVREQHVRGGSAVAVFACSADDFWHTYTFPHRLSNAIYFNHTPYVKPLFRLLDRFQPTVAVIVGKGKARIFLIQGDTIQELSDISTPVPKRHDQGGWAQARLQRAHDEAVGHHLKITADQLFEVYQQTGFSKLVIAGTDPVVSEFKEYLHPYLKERLVGTFALGMTASPKTVKERTEELVREAEIREAEDLMRKLENEIGSGDLGVAGLRETLRAIQKGQVMTLLVNDGYTEAGKRCIRCGNLTLRAEPHCPYCGGKLELVADIVSEILDRAFEQDCEVKVLEDGIGDRLKSLGHIGALLRFKVT